MSEEIKFLKDLQEELKTQETDYQAAPRFWVIRDYRIVPGNEEYDDCRTSYFHNNGDHSEFKDVEELKEFLTEYYSDDYHSSGLEKLIENPDTTFDETWDFVTEYMNDDGFFNECPVTEESFNVMDTMFLTKSEAQKHLELNHYHYSKKAHTYAMTAWRAPKVGRLLEILETFPWEKVQLIEGGGQS